jgi:hypothetical protein
VTDTELTIQEQATNAETWRHINRVQQLLVGVTTRLVKRAVVHDQSKLVPPEVGVFATCTERLKGLTYGSPEYKQCLVEMKPALDHHYANNSHHPEFYKDGVDGMDLLDLMEMLCDWKAATERHANGSLIKSLEINTERFKLSPQLRRILENTAARLWNEQREAVRKTVEAYRQYEANKEVT